MTTPARAASAARTPKTSTPATATSAAHGVARTAPPSRHRAPSGTTFASLGVPAALIASLASGGIDAPFPIQSATLPDSLAGRDVLGRGRTGSGKTVAFALPLVAALAGQRSTAGQPRGLVLVPTRELAIQVDATIAPLAKSMGLRTRTIFGGVGQNPQVSALAAGVDIIVATPGRLADLIKQRHASLGAIVVTVIDEADHMADLGFLPEVRSACSTRPPPAVSGCCSPRPWTPASTCLRAATCTTRSPTRSTPQPRPCRRWTITCSPSTPLSGR